MPAETALRDGKVDEALTELMSEVRQDPSNGKHRVFLFQLLSVCGQWGRALTQLNVAAELDAENLAMAQMYREALRSEAFRCDVFQGRRSPIMLGEPPPWVGWLLEALRGGASGELSGAQQLRERAFEQAPASSGQIDGKPFAWIADADPRLGPVLEAVVDGKYYWVPFENVQEICIEEPEDLRDVVWMPAHFRWRNGAETVGVIPTRYTDSENSEDEQIRLARKTVWVEQGKDLVVGQGQRMLATDIGEYSLMDIRRITFDTDGPTTETGDQGSSTEESVDG